MIAEQLLKTEQSLKDRGLPQDSFFEATFRDGSVITEHSASWASFSHQETVEYFGGRKMCMVSNHPIKRILIRLNDMIAEIDVPDDAGVYQFIRSERLLAKDIDRHTLIGRGIGIIQNGSVTEEKFIDVIENKVMGMRK